MMTPEERRTKLATAGETAGGRPAVLMEWLNLAYDAWGLIANVDGGTCAQSAEWEFASRRWSDAFHRLAMTAGGSPTRGEAAPKDSKCGVGPIVAVAPQPEPGASAPLSVKPYLTPGSLAIWARREEMAYRETGAAYDANRFGAVADILERVAHDAP